MFTLDLANGAQFFCRPECFAVMHDAPHVIDEGDVRDLMVTMAEEMLFEQVMSRA